MCKKCLKMRILFATAGFVAGAATGAISVYFLNKKKFDEQNDIIEELLDEINDGVNEINSATEEVEAASKFLNEISDEVFSPSKKDVKDLKDLIKDQGYSKVPGDSKPDLSSFSERDPVDDESFEPEDEIPMQPAFDVSHQIPIEEFVEDKLNTKDTVNYFVTVNSDGDISEPMSDVFYDKDDDAMDIENYADLREMHDAIKLACYSGQYVIYWRCPRLELDLEIVINDEEESDDSDLYERGGYEKKSRKKPKKSEME